MKTVLCDPYLSDECKNKLCSMGFSVLEIPAYNKLPKQIASHPDILIFKLNDGSLLMGDEYYRAFSDFYDSLGVKIVTDRLGPHGEYPSDVLFDALAIGDTLYGKKGAVSELLVKNYPRFVPVNQGYTRCSVAMIDECSAVTADKGIASALIRDGISVLEIGAGNIELNGYNCGFIGGAGGKLSSDTYCFFGDLCSHPDGEAIRLLVEEKKIKAVSLSGGPLCDHGSLIVI